jgi:hypothetical protein
MRWFFDNVMAGGLRFIVASILWNWVAIMSVLSAIGIAAWAWINKYDYLQISLAGLAAFVLVLWTCIGFIWIYGLSVKNDYGWTLAYGGLVLGLDQGNPDATLQIGVNFLNVSASALHYKVEELRVIIDDRTIANPKYDNQGGIIPRGLSRTYRFPPFKKASIEDFLGKRVAGTVEFSVAYGPYDSAPVRRLRMKLNVSFRLDDKFGISDTIVSESEENLD